MGESEADPTHHRPKVGLLASSWQQVAKWLVDGTMPFSKDGPRAPSSENQVGQSFQDHSRFQGSLNSPKLHGYDLGVAQGWLFLS